MMRLLLVLAIALGILPVGSGDGSQGETTGGTVTPPEPGGVTAECCGGPPPCPPLCGEEMD